MSLLATFCDRDGDAVITTVLLDEKPAIGETVVLYDSQDTLQNRKVVDVRHHIYRQQTDPKGDVRVYVLLDVGKEEL